MSGRLLVVVTVLTLAPMQAWAECAWVVWSVDSRTAKPVKDETAENLTYTFRLSAPTEEKCGDFAIDLYRRREKEKRVAFGQSGYVCVPDTIDPRGPKGSGR